MTNRTVRGKNKIWSSWQKGQIQQGLHHKLQSSLIIFELIIFLRRAFRSAQALLNKGSLTTE